MELRFQPSLIQEVIDAFIEKTEREGDPTFYKEFHELADPIYENFPLDDREPEFQKLYQYLFGHWGFADIIDNAFNEFSELKGRIGITLVRGVLKEDQESVDILRKWGTVHFTHPELIEMATDTLKVIDRAIEVEGAEIPERKKIMLMPGFPCPLCGFPTYNWVENLEKEVEPEVLDYIRQNHPGWDPEYGGCDRCIEVYKLRAAGVMGD